MSMYAATVKVPTALYRLWAADGALLYIGITHTPDKRFTQHSYEKAWWHEVASKTLAWHPDRKTAEQAEIDAIAAEQPRYNVLPGAITTLTAHLLPSAETAMPRKNTAGSLDPQQATGSTATEPNVSHVHELAPHAHVGAWCSARFWCAGCRTWLEGKPCEGTRAALPDLARLTA